MAARAALEVDAQVQAALARPAMHLYVGCLVPRLRLRELAIDIDNTPLVHRLLDQPEAEALSKGGLVDVGLLHIAPGAHRLHAYFAAAKVDASPYEPREVGTLDRHWGQAVADSGSLVFEVAKGLVGGSELRMTVQAAAGAAPPTTLETTAFAPGSVADPEVRVAEWYLHQHEALQAASRLAIPRSTGGASALAQDRYADALQMLDDEEHDATLPAAASSASASADAAAVDGDALLAADRLNLAQGYDALRALHYEEAAGFFRKVHTPGPCASRALLGLGWALAGRGGSGVTKDAVADAAGVRNVREHMPVSASTAHPAGAARTAVREALVPWTELIGRERFDPAVQEGALAVAYGLDYVGDHEAAQAQYNRSIALLEGTRAELAQGIEDVRHGRLVSDVLPLDGDVMESWHHTLAHIDARPQQAYVRALIVDPEFERATADYLALLGVRSLLAHDGALLSGADAASAAPLAARLQAEQGRCDLAVKAQATRVEAAAVAALQALDRITGTYLAEADLAIARANDVASAEGAP